VRPSRAAVAVALLTLPLGTTDAAADEVGARTVFRYTDDAITESSGLVARKGLMLTANDSGDGPLIYAVDPGTGSTVGVTTYSEGPVSDVEALAPGQDGVVWVGDIGDNNADRPAVDVYPVPAAASAGDREVDAVRYRLGYTDGPHDAEALLVHPTTGRLHVVSKGILGGTVYAAPAALDPDAVNRMQAMGQVPGVVTDGAFLPDGRHIVLRTYGTAAVYTFPGLRQLSSFDLPAQEQGETLAVDEDGRVFVGTEGVNTEVQEIALPETGLPRTAPPTETAPSETAAPAPQVDAADPASEPADRNGNGVWVAGGAALLALAGGLLVTASRRRSRRTQ
jgi:hypothetical protein